MTVDICGGFNTLKVMRWIAVVVIVGLFGAVLPVSAEPGRLEYATDRVDLIWYNTYGEGAQRTAILFIRDGSVIDWRWYEKVAKYPSFNSIEPGYPYTLIWDDLGTPRTVYAKDFRKITTVVDLELMYRGILPEDQRAKLSEGWSRSLSSLMETGSPDDDTQLVSDVIGEGPDDYFAEAPVLLLESDVMDIPETEDTTADPLAETLVLTLVSDLDDFELVEEESYIMPLVSDIGNEDYEEFEEYTY